VQTGAARVYAAYQNEKAATRTRPEGIDVPPASSSSAPQPKTAIYQKSVGPRRLR